MDSGNTIEGAILKFIGDLEEVEELLDRSCHEARKKENELCAQLVEEYGYGDLAELIRDSARW